MPPLLLLLLLAAGISGRMMTAASLPEPLADSLVQHLAGHLRTRGDCDQVQYRRWLSECWQRDAAETERVGVLRARALARAAFHAADACTQPQPPARNPSDLLSATTPRQLLEALRTVLDDDGCQQFFGFDSLQSALAYMRSPRDEERRMSETRWTELATAIADRLLTGQCVGATREEQEVATAVGRRRSRRSTSQPTNIYLDALFSKYADNSSDGKTANVTLEGINQLLVDVQLDPPPESDDSQKSGGVGASRTRRRRRSAGGDDDNGGGRWSSEPSLVRVLRELVSSAQELSERSPHPHRAPRAAVRTEDDDTPWKNMTVCLDANQLMSTFDRDNSNSLDEQEFLQLCAYVVYQISEGRRCKPDQDSGDPFNAAKVYGYGTLCVFVISACSALGFLIIPTLSASVYDILMTSFIALAFGTLTGDALLHLFPESILGDAADSGYNGVVTPDSFYKCLVIMMSIYLLYVFEGLTGLLVGHSHGEGASDQDQHGHSHAHSHDFIREQTEKAKEKGQQLDSGAVVVVVAAAAAVSPEHKSDWNLSQIDSQTSIVSADSQSDVIQPPILNPDQVPVCLGLTSLALVIIVGDAIHNVTDGISIGASFAHDIKGGLSTALAVFFHELPHEFGDFVILLTTGLTLKRALLWNFVSSLSAFVGLYVGIAVGENDNAIEWIFAMTSGMFLYVAIADMLPEMRKMKSSRPYVEFLAQNIGALFGMGFMVFMYFLEDFMKF